MIPYKCIFFILTLLILSQTRGDENEIDTYQSLIQSPDKGSSINNSSKHSNTRLVCFYVFTTDFKSDIMDGLCTHINVGFFDIDKKNYSLVVLPDQQKVLFEILKLKESNDKLKILISVGGANESGFSSMITKHKQRKWFIRTCMEYIKAYKIDGIDLDWEWPVINTGKQKEKLKFIQLLREFREEFDRHKKKYILSVDVSSTPAIVELVYYTHYISKYVDHLNVMSYDYHFFTKLFPFTGHNSPLYSTENFPFPQHNINHSISFWLSESVPKEKIVVGLPTYGHTFELTFSNKHSLNAPAKGFGTMGQSGFAKYTEICMFLRLKNTTVVYDDVSKVPYAYLFPDWVSYDDEFSVATKANYILEHGLGGAMVFSVNADDVSGTCNGTPLPLIRKIRSILFNEP